MSTVEEHPDSGSAGGPSPAGQQAGSSGDQQAEGAQRGAAEQSPSEEMRTAFLSPDAEDLFVSVAAFSDAQDLVELDVPEGHAHARQALETAIRNAEARRASEGARLALIKGTGGSGKTHVLSATLRAASEDPAREIYPAVLQLTAPVKVGEYARWLVDAVFRELSARHFPGSRGQSPLRRLADKLLERVSDDAREAFSDFVEDPDDGELLIARNLGERIRQKGLVILEDMPPSAGFIAALILAGYGDESAIIYLRRGLIDERTRELGLLPVENAQDQVFLLQSLGLAVSLAGATLVLAFDQVENVVRLGSEALFVHGLTQAVRLAHDIRCLAIGIVVLDHAYETLAAGTIGLSNTDRDRIERMPPSAVKLGPLPARLTDEILLRRLAVLRRRAGLSPERERSFEPLPEVLVQKARGAASIREALLYVSTFRENTMRKGWEETPPPPPPPPPPEDFSKLWADFHDSGPVGEVRRTSQTKAELFRWYAEAASREVSAPYSVGAKATSFSPPRTHVVDIDILQSDNPVLRRQLAICDAKNRDHQLPGQVNAFLEWCEGVPIIYRDKGFPQGRTAQVAPALENLRGHDGLVVEVAPSEWNTLSLAKDFVQKHGGEDGFVAWQKDRQWLHQLVKPLAQLIACPKASPEPEEPQSQESTEDPSHQPSDGPFPVFVGEPLEGEPNAPAILWDPYRPKPDQLNNFSVLVTGDSGAGKTQTIRVLIDAACRAELPVLIFDFKKDYGDAEFTGSLGLEVVDVRHHGLPFNPLKPPPRGASGAQPAEHAYEIAGVFRRVFRLGDVQEGKLRDAIHQAYEDFGIFPREWIDPERSKWPGFDLVIEKLREEKGTANIVTRLGPLVDLGLLRSGEHELGFDEILKRRVVLSLGDLTDELKAALAEILIIQIHGHSLRGEQPRKLKRLMVFDEAHRIAGSRRLEALGREGRAFGVGIVLGTQFPGDIPETLAGSMATSLFLMNNQADHRKAVVRQVVASPTSAEGKALSDALAKLSQLEGLFHNAHFRSTLVKVRPHFARQTSRTA